MNDPIQTPEALLEAIGEELCIIPFPDEVKVILDLISARDRAVRARALEEAAKVAESYHDRDAAAIATEIRALASL